MSAHEVSAHASMQRDDDDEPLRAILFDVDDTLVDFGASAVAGVADLLGTMVVDTQLQVGLPHAWHELTEFHYPRFLSGELNFLDMQLARLAALLGWAGLPVPHREALIALEHRRQQVMTLHYQLFPDVLPALELARAAGYAIGVVSNSDGNHQRAKLFSVGLADAFSAAIISGDLGISKPDPRIFLAACEALGFAPSQVAYVGDKLDIDALGAQSAGLTGIWLDRRGSANTAGPLEGVTVITTLAELANLYP
ncbi:HAD family hydrolase [Nakamurella antarctica]|uniref:HAD family hydrolase n=1 Tax=Nakamurella antarctica TaxID=1902245 RepID=A0A3G8ZMJ6_9ACTN|nr:HAD family hydrolase [Nakamurella antarctica]AZI58473.1 HAD family hydrolase [Nakamurella antarctica]